MTYSEGVKFQRIGDIAILTRVVERSKAKVLMKKLGVKTICAKTGPVSGVLRRPRIKVLAGNGTETVHRESGCLYKLDVTRLMFSKGNVKERHRPARLVRSGEVVVDMFAGIGYFSIPLAKACPGCRVYSIELNPDAVCYLKENVKLNNVKNITVIEGDCRSVSVPEKADRVIMGYLPDTEKFLSAAFGFLKPAGIIHFHNTCMENELWSKPLESLRRAAEKAGYKLRKILYKGKVKQYAPRVWHVVIDAEFRSVG